MGLAVTYIDKSMGRKHEVEFRLPPDLQSIIYLGWGLHLKRVKRINGATIQFERSLQCNQKRRTLIELVKCYIDTNNLSKALETVEQSVGTYGACPETSHLIHDCLFGLNIFEEAIRHSCNIPRKYTSDHLAYKFADTVHETLTKVFRPTVEPLVHRYAHKAKAINEGHTHYVSAKPEYGDDVEVLENREYDVESLCGQTHIADSPLDDRKLSAKKQIKNAHYFNATVDDHLKFWSDTLNHKHHIVSQFPMSSAALNQILKVDIGHVDMCIEKLWSRRPLYTRQTIPSKATNRIKANELKHLRNMSLQSAFSHISYQRKMALNSTLSQIICYTDTILTKFYAVTPESILPRKFEFINEICNLVALKYLEKALSIPYNIMSLRKHGRLHCLLKIDSPENDSAVIGTVGVMDRVPLRKQRAKNPAEQTLLFNTRSYSIQERICYSQYEIEKVYLNFLLSSLCLRERKLEECQRYSGNCINGANEIQNYVWQFVGHMNSIRAFALKDNYIRIRASLVILKEIATKLDQKAVDFVNVMSFFVNDISDEQ